MKTIDVDTTRFTQALAALGSISRRELPDVVNKSMANVVRFTIWNTPKTERSAIERLRTQVATRVVRDRKTGRLKSGAGIFRPQTLVYRIINKRRTDAGRSGLTGKAMGTAARKLIASRLRSIGFMRSGWIPAVRLFLNRQNMAGGRIRGKVKGRATKATPGRVEAEIVNSIERAARTARLGSEPLQKGMDREERELINSVARRLRVITRRTGL